MPCLRSATRPKHALHATRALFTRGNRKSPPHAHWRSVWRTVRRRCPVRSACPPFGRGEWACHPDAYARVAEQVQQIRGRVVKEPTECPELHERIRPSASKSRLQPARLPHGAPPVQPSPSRPPRRFPHPARADRRPLPPLLQLPSRSSPAMRPPSVRRPSREPRSLLRPFRLQPNLGHLPSQAEPAPSPLWM